MQIEGGDQGESNIWSLHHLPDCCLHASQSLLLQMSGISRYQLSNGRQIAQIARLAQFFVYMLLSHFYYRCQAYLVILSNGRQIALIARLAQFFAYISYLRQIQQLLHHLHRARPTCQLTLVCDFYSRYVGLVILSAFQRASLRLNHSHLIDAK